MNPMRLYHTLRPLRAAQWTDRLVRPLKARLLRDRTLSPKHLEAAKALSSISLPRFVTSDAFEPITGQARFLNLSHCFDSGAIDWNFQGHGKLWAYHLNYFGWVEKLDDAKAVRFGMQDYCQHVSPSSIGAEPYPASRRIQHWIAAMLRMQLRDEELLARLYADAWRLARLPEHHLQANHLLQNGLAIVAAAYFFDDEELYRRAARLLRIELSVQVLPDGGHIERSASYTADLCARILSCLHLQRHTGRYMDDELTGQMRSTSSRMLSWLNAYAFLDGSLAALGDSSSDMMPPLSLINEAAAELKIPTGVAVLHESGYRKTCGERWEGVLNVGSPAPAFQPGHSHADALTFCLHAHGRPLIVDTGISTYERSARRALERGTDAHNTVTVCSQNSSDVWAAFRMGRRARVEILEEDSSMLIVGHDGYRNLGLRHVRTFDWKNGSVLRIADCVEGKGTSDVTSNLHFHPDVSILQTDEWEWSVDNCRIKFQGLASVAAEPYQWAAGFNLLRPAIRLRCNWRAAKTEIQFHF